MKIPPMITNAEADRIRRQLSEPHRTIFDLARETGLRISDILKIKACDIAPSMSVIESKTGKINAFKLSETLYKRLKRYYTCKTMNYAFQSTRDSKKHIHRSTVHRHLKRAGHWSDINLSTHSARKLFAMNIFHKTGKVKEVQKALNHKYMSTTLSYLNINLDELISEVRP